MPATAPLLSPLLLLLLAPALVELPAYGEVAVDAAATRADSALLLVLLLLLLLSTLVDSVAALSVVALSVVKSVAAFSVSVNDDGGDTLDDGPVAKLVVAADDVDKDTDGSTVIVPDAVTGIVTAVGVDAAWSSVDVDVVAGPMNSTTLES